MKKLTVVIPVFNEEKTIEAIVQKVLSTKLLNNIRKEIILIDDFSNDKSREIISKIVKNNNDCKSFLKDFNSGKGASIHKGIEMASGDYLIVQDADLEYDPGEYNKLIKPVLSVKADVVYGSRFNGSDPHRILFFWHTIGNKFLTFLSNMFNNLNLTDMETCYKLIKLDLLKSMNLKEKRFGFEPEITAKLSKVKNIKIYEVGISYYGRTYQEGKKINWRDWFRAIYCIIKYGL